MPLPDESSIPQLLSTGFGRAVWKDSSTAFLHESSVLQAIVWPYACSDPAGGPVRNDEQITFPR